MAKFSFSIFNETLGVDPNRSVLVDAADSILRAGSEADRWRVSREGFWCGVTPYGSIQRRQGWKLHLSATVSSAEEVLVRAVPVLLA
ncbi:MAG: class III lanthionine synthetase LanKC N-terminal domain-containing protein, partial [Pseudonocardiales bacterium]